MEFTVLDEVDHFTIGNNGKENNINTMATRKHRLSSDQYISWLQRGSEPNAPLINLSFIPSLATLPNWENANG